MKRIGAFLLVFLFLLVCSAVYIAQPILPVSNIGYKQTVSSKRLATHVNTLVQADRPRDAAHPENLDAVAAYIRKEFTLAHAVIDEQVYQVDSLSYRNVIASFGPNTTERIVIGAHYDTHGALPGADDNASGIAGLIELAYLLEKAKPNLRVDLVAYTLEEPPYFRTEHMGSKVHATHLHQQGVNVRAMISLEMIGYFSDEVGSQNYPSALLKLIYPARGNYISVVGNIGEGNLVRKVKRAMQLAAPLPVYSINAPRIIPGIDFSDHQGYWDVGYPALMVTDTAFNRNFNYHTKEDTPERLDYSRMAQVVEQVFAAVTDLAR